MAWQWKLLADIQGLPGDVSLYGPGWAPQRNVPSDADLNVFKTPGIHRISTPDTNTIQNLPSGMNQAGIFENLLTGTGADDWWVQRISEHGTSPCTWWRSTRDTVGGWNEWEQLQTNGGKVTELHVFLAVGQSNMSGRGEPFGGSRDPENQRILEYGAKSSPAPFTRALATAGVPLNMHDTASGLSPATSFARAYLKTQPSHVGVLIIPAAHGSTGFTSSTTQLTWTPNVATDATLDLPALAVAQTNEGITAAKAAGYTVSLEGILWHQGENNTTMSQTTYATNLDALIAYFRTALGNSKLPFVVGQMSPEGIEANAGRENIDAAHKATPSRVAFTGFAPSTRGGHNSGDTTHLSRIGVEFLGRTYAEALTEAKTLEDVKPRLTAVEATMVPQWRPNTAYASGQRVIAPNGDVVTAKTGFTAGATYSATNWNPSTALRVMPNLGGDDLNNITTPGIYHQSSSTTPTVALNYPLSGRGRLTVTPVSASIIGQEFWATFLKRLFVREYNGTTWSGWAEIGAAGGFGGAPLLIRGNLASEDLDTITTPGIYGQSTSATATTARHYPVDAAGRGVLTVENVSTSIISQQYNATFLQRVFYREFDGTTWNTWKELGTGGTGTGTGSDPALAARVSTTENSITALAGVNNAQNGRLTTLESQSGLANPVKSASVTGDGLLRFTLADDTVTSGVTLPTSLPTEQVDYVEQMLRRVTRGTVEIKKINSLGGLEVSAVAPNGEHTTYEFKGTAADSTDDDYKMQQRVWVGDSTGGTRNKTYRVGPSSNRDFAIEIAAAGSGLTPAFMPDHGSPTAFNVEPPKYYGGGVLLDIDSMSVGQVTVLNGPFEVVQHVVGRHPSAPTTDLIEVWTSQIVTPDRRLSVDGKWRALVDVTLGANYHLMCPVDSTMFDTVVTSLNNKYLNTADKYGTSTYLSVEADVAISYAFLSSTNNSVAVGFRYNNIAETMRRGLSGKDSLTARTFLQHRDADILKLYNKPYASGTTIAAGTVNRFSGDYLFMQGHAMYSQYAL